MPRQTYDEICLKVKDESGALCLGDKELHTKMVHLAWALFLAVRGRFGVSDLVPGLFLLIACLHAVLSGRSQAFQNALVFPEPRDAAAKDAMEKDAVAKDPQLGGGGAESAKVLSKLCKTYCGTEPFMLAQAHDALNKVHTLLDDLLPGLEEDGYKKDVDGRGIGEDGMLEASFCALTSLVLAGLPSRSVQGESVEVDGIIFLQHPELVGSPKDKKRRGPSLPSSPAKIPRSPTRSAGASCRPPCSPMRGQHVAFSPMRGQNLAMAPKTPERSVAMYQDRNMSAMPAAVTPMQGVMKDVRWLSLYVQAESTRPGEILRSFFAACDTDQTASVVARLDNLPEQIVANIDEDLVATAVKLYLKSLRFILQREEERLKRNNFTNILQDDSMHRAFLAISFEMVLHTHMRHHMPFPQIPMAFKVCALEFYIMTDNFLNYFQDILPTEVRRHLVHQREAILDQANFLKKYALSYFIL